MPLDDQPLSRAVAIASRDIQLPHQDPADRFIAATAVVNDLTLLTHDALLLTSPSVRTLGPS